MWQKNCKRESLKKRFIMAKDKKHDEVKKDVKDQNTQEKHAENLEKEAKADSKKKSNKEEKPEPVVQIITKEVEVEVNVDFKDRYIRLAADFDNYRKRTLKERMDLIKNANEDIIKDILPVFDDFERARDAMNFDQENPDSKANQEGVDLIYNKFKDFLKNKGVVQIEAKDVAFDTDKHEAITKIPAPTPNLVGKNVDVVENGYTLNDKVLRYAKVVVGE